jgi:hypothetical protein
MYCAMRYARRAARCLQVLPSKLALCLWCNNNLCCAHQTTTYVLRPSNCTSHQVQFKVKTLSAHHHALRSGQTHDRLQFFAGFASCVCLLRALPFRSRRLCGSVASYAPTRLPASIDLPGRPHGHCPDYRLPHCLLPAGQVTSPWVWASRDWQAEAVLSASNALLGGRANSHWVASRGPSSENRG